MQSVQSRRYILPHQLRTCPWPGISLPIKIIIIHLYKLKFCDMLSQAGISSALYSDHRHDRIRSLYGSCKVIKDSVIQILGRWKNS